MKRNKKLFKKSSQISPSDTKRKLNRNLKLYGYNIIGAIIMMIIILIGNYTVSDIKADYELQKIEGREENNESLLNVEYHYYLDFSPSMLGYFDDSVNTGMNGFVNSLETIDESGNQKLYYRCTNKIENITSTNFYESMKSTEAIRDYYDSIIAAYESEEQSEEILMTIQDTNLADIFSRRYDDGKNYVTGKDSINIIISDLNFQQGLLETEFQSSSMEFLEQFSRGLQKKEIDSNIGIYCLYSGFAGIETDAYEMDENYESSREEKAFFVIVLSENETVYSQFTQKLEEELTKANVDCSNKYELLNRVVSSDFDLGMEMDLNSLDTLGLIEKTNLNYDNSSFKELDKNELGMRIVSGTENKSVLLEMGITPLNDEDAVLQDTNMEVSAEAVVSKHTVGGGYEEYGGEDVIQYLSAGTQWKQDKEYLKFSVELNPDAAIMESQGNKIGRSFHRDFYVVELQFYIEKPSYPLPKWLVTADDAEAESGDNTDSVGNNHLEEISSAFQEIANSKKISYSEIEKNKRYLGSFVLYLTY